MRNALAILLAAIAVAGSLGMFLYGHAIAGVFETLALRARPAEVPSSLVNLRLASSAFAAFFIGTLGSFGLRLLGGTLKSQHRWPGIAIGVLMAIGGGILVTRVFVVMRSFQVIANSTTTPKAEEIEFVFSSLQPQFGVGYGVLMATSMAVFTLAVLELRASGARHSSPVWTGAGAICILLLPLTLLFTWSLRHAAYELQRITMGEVLAKPVDFAVQLNSMLTWSFLRSSSPSAACRLLHT
ncbi:MAG: hypothetical protein KDA88_22720 [Planctomycetaceae bacterium]|nr:hypothetical protein [Planctomycetaceae bacterium]MCB9951466.1 hypothetical protein [Planctomycetaceae bacterium]